MSPTRSGGIAYGLAAYTLWGFFPLYFHQLAHVPAPHVLAHRAAWACVFAAAVLLGLRWGPRIATLLRQPRLVAMLCVSALLIGANWLIFIWAVGNGRVLASSLGYFVSPLVSVLLGVVVLRERLDMRERVAVALAVAAVANEVIALGRLPWVSLSLAVTFALYGLVRKKVPTEALSGLFVETLVMLPPLAAYALFDQAQGRGLIAPYDAATLAWLVAAGPVTALPLIAFAAAARRLHLATLGMLMYINPSLQMASALLLGEHLRPGQGLTFALIWAGLALYSWSAWRRTRTLVPGTHES